MENYNEIFGVNENNWQEKIPRINRYIEIKARLQELDEKSTRSIRSLLSGSGSESDKKFLAEIENEAEELRKEMYSLINK